MHFDKPALTIEEQIDLLEERGLVIPDRQEAQNWFSSVSYYRLSGYWLPFETPAGPSQTRSKLFMKGTAFQDITSLYMFDRQLRLIIMEAIERIEIALRARWTYYVVNKLNSHAYLEPENFDLDYWHSKYWSMVQNLCKSVRLSDEAFIKHYNKKYKTPNLPPLWAVTELMTFGELSIWVSITKDKQIIGKVAKDLGFPNTKTLEGTLQNISLVRNKCAHHSRVWNRKFTKRLPSIKKLANTLVYSAPIQNRQTENKIYNTLVVLIYLLREQAPTTSYPSRLKQLINSRSSGDQREMGFPVNWESLPFWDTKPSGSELNSRNAT